MECNNCIRNCLPMWSTVTNSKSRHNSQENNNLATIDATKNIKVLQLREWRLYIYVYIYVQIYVVPVLFRCPSLTVIRLFTAFKSAIGCPLISGANILYLRYSFSCQRSMCNSSWFYVHSGLGFNRPLSKSCLKLSLEWSLYGGWLSNIVVRTNEYNRV